MPDPTSSGEAIEGCGAHRIGSHDDWQLLIICVAVQRDMSMVMLHAMVVRGRARVVGSGLVFQGAQPADLPRRKAGSSHSDITEVPLATQSPSAHEYLYQSHNLDQ